LRNLKTGSDQPVSDIPPSSVVAPVCPPWIRPAVVTVGGSTALAALAVAVRLPAFDSVVWSEAVAVAGSVVVLLVVTWWLTGRADGPDWRIAVPRGVAVGFTLGGLWLAEIAFNNPTILVLVAARCGRSVVAIGRYKATMPRSATGGGVAAAGSKQSRRHRRERPRPP